MTKLWNRIERWADIHLPELRDSLNGPADAKMIAAVEDECGQPLPREYAESCLVHDGQADTECGLLLGYRLLPLEETLAHRARVTLRDEHDEIESLPVGFTKLLAICPLWLPFAHDHAGNYLAIDLAPGKRGTVGQVILFGRDERTHIVTALGFADFLEKIFSYLERGEWVRDSGNIALRGQVPDLLDFISRGSPGVERARRFLVEAAEPNAGDDAAEEEDDLPVAPPLPVTHTSTFNAAFFADEAKVHAFYIDGCGFMWGERGPEHLKIVTNDFQEITLVPKTDASKVGDVVLHVPSKFLDALERRLRDSGISVTPLAKTKPERGFGIVDPEGNTVSFFRLA